MNDVDLAEVIKSIETSNGLINFDVLIFCVSDGSNMGGGLLTSKHVDREKRKPDFVDMVGYMMKNLDINKNDIALAKELRVEEKLMLSMIKDIEDL